MGPAGKTTALLPRAVEITRNFLSPTVCLGLLFLVVIWIVSVYQSSNERQRDKAAMHSHVANLTLASEQNIKRTIDQLDTLLKVIRNAHKLLEGRVPWATIIHSDYGIERVANQVGAIDAKGMLISNTFRPNPETPVDLSDRDHFKVHLGTIRDQIYVSRPVFGRLSQRWSIQISRPFWQTDGSFGGVLVASLDPSKLTQSFGNFDLGAGGGVALIASDDIVRAGTGAFAASVGRGYREGVKLGETVVQLPVPESSTITLTTEEFDGRPRLVAMRTIPGLPLQIIVAATEPEATTAWYLPSDPYIILASLCSFVVLVAVYAALNGERQAAQSRQLSNLMEVEKKVAESAATDRSLFLAVMSHEIRTPLNGVLGALDLIRDDNLSERSRRYVNVATESGEALVGLIDDILSISKYEMNQIDLANDPFVLERLFRSVYEAMAPLAGKSHNVLKVSICPSALRPVVGDYRRLRQVLSNLVGNAIKFTSHGTIVLRVTELPRQEDKLAVRISVTDSGIGIPKEKHKLIFDRFQTLDPTYTRRADGTGLGLAISDKLIQTMGGQITVESEVGRGSCFSFDLTLPYAAEHQRGDRKQIPADHLFPTATGPLRILLAEDNPTNADVATQFLIEAGHSVRHAANGRVAVAVASSDTFDLILMDISMPEMDGIEATRRIRASGSDNAKKPIIALTAHAVSGDQDKFLNAQMDGYLTKPIRKAVLLDAVRSFASASQTVSTAPAPQIPTTQPQAADLVLDTADFLEFISERSLDRVPKTIEIFVSELETKAKALVEIISLRDPKALQMLAHSTLGSGAMMGAARLVKLSRTIEASCVCNQPDWNDADTLLIVLRDTIVAFSPLRSKDALCAWIGKRAAAA